MLCARSFPAAAEAEVPGWNPDCNAAIDAADTLAAAGAACRTSVLNLGFAYFQLELRLMRLKQGPTQLTLCGYPEEWRTRYEICGYVKVDPLPGQALGRIIPFAWDELERSSAEVSALFEDASRHGLRCGFSVPIRGVRGSFSLLSLARPEPLPAEPDRLDRLYRNAHWLALRLHQRLCGLLEQQDEFKVRSSRLSPRERECMSLAAQGYSARGIGRKLGIAERTAIFHLNHAMEKLGARKRQHAIALAASLDLLDLAAPRPEACARTLLKVEQPH